MHHSKGEQRGQAAVEAALTLPLTLFLILGTLQLFVMIQARIMAEHAVFRSVRAGSLSQGSCTRMLQAAITTLLPTFNRTDSPATLSAAFAGHAGNRFVPATDGGNNGQIVWLLRPSPLAATIASANADDEAFDDPDQPLIRLEVQMIFWYPMRIPFANWVISKTMLAVWGLSSYSGQNPLMPANNESFRMGTPGSMSAAVLAEFQARSGTPPGTFVFPIQASASMRMMTPPRTDYFTPQDCQ